jgi:hypothetical protein
VGAARHRLSADLLARCARSFAHRRRLALTRSAPRDAGSPSERVRGSNGRGLVLTLLTPRRSGTANELREALREVIDHLAPDEEILRVSGFKLERGQTKPTHKQKVRHILRSRDVPATARKAPEETTTLVEELTASVARASYQRTSVSTHIVTARAEVRATEDVRRQRPC